jgi:hypothetical protein
MDGSASLPARSQYGKLVTWTSDPAICIDGLDKKSAKEANRPHRASRRTRRKTRERSQSGGAGSRGGATAAEARRIGREGENEAKTGLSRAIEAKLGSRLQLLYGSLFTRGKLGIFDRQTKPIRTLTRGGSVGGSGTGRAARGGWTSDGSGAESEQTKPNSARAGGRFGEWSGANGGALSAVEFGFLLRLSGPRLQ